MIYMADESEVTHTYLSLVSKIHMGTVDTDYSNLSRIKICASLEYLDPTPDSIVVNNSTQRLKNNTVCIRGCIYIYQGIDKNNSRFIFTFVRAFITDVFEFNILRRFMENTC